MKKLGFDAGVEFFFNTSIPHMVPMQSCADLRVGTGAEAAALLPTSNHCPRDSVLFQQKVCPIAKYQLQVFPVKTGITYDISHNSRENYWNFSSQAAVMWLISLDSTPPGLHFCRLASLNIHRWKSCKTA